MARIIMVLAAIGILAIAPAEANANAGLPWFGPHEFSCSLLSSSPKTDQVGGAAATNNQKPRKRMLAMSIANGRASRRAPGTNPLSSSSSLAVLVSLLGMVGIGTLTRAVPVKDIEKIR